MSADAVLPPLPWLLAAVNRAAALGPGRPRLDPESMITAARRRTGLDDLGDPPYDEPLRRLSDDLERGGLSLTGRVAVRTLLDELLVTRLEIQAALARRPDALDEHVDRPLFILGLPRSGTTFLHRLIACDPSTRWLSEAEALYPPVPGLERRQARRVRTYRVMQRLTVRLVPSLTAMHDRLDPTAPEEEVPLLERAFTCPMFGVYCDTPRYDAWLSALDSTAWLGVYRYVRRQLQLIQLARPGGPWVLKSPSHALGVHALLEIFPDARIVQIDRDPVAVAASYLSLEATTRSVFMEPRRYDPRSVGHCMLEFLARYHGRLAAARRAAPDRAVLLRYDDLIADPLAQVRHIYVRWGRPLSAEAERRMRAYLAAHPQHKHGVHRYHLAAWGVTEDEIRAAVAPRPD